MKTLLHLVCSAVLLAAFVRAGPPTPEPIATPTVATAGPKFTCPRHPAVIAAEPGPCPRCGMKLSPKK